MNLLVIKRDRWAVLGMVDERGICAVAEFLDELRGDAGPDAGQVQALITLVAASGPPRNEKRSRRLDGPIYELKTRGGIRIPYFYDEVSVVICTEALRKPNQAEPKRVIERAKIKRHGYHRAKRQGTLRLLEEDE